MSDPHPDRPGAGDLGAELRGLATWLDIADPVDQRAAVRARLERPVRKRRPVRVIVAAALAALAGTVAAVAPARAAVVDAVDGLLRVAGIVVEREPGAGPPVPARPSPLPSVRVATIEEARRTALFQVRVPSAWGAPDQVVLADPDAGGAPRLVTMIYRGGAVRFDQFDGAVEPAFFKTTQQAESVDLDGGAIGLWLPGPHAVTYVGRDGVRRTETARLATPTLIWAGESLTYRLEGLTSLTEARAVANSLQ